MKKLLALALLLVACEKPMPILGDEHSHADFKLYIQGEEFNFAQEKYMSTPARSLSNFIHLHDMHGDVIHKHMSTITMGDFFDSIGMELTDECLTLDDGRTYCSDDENKLQMFVNGDRVRHMADYELEDLDRILLTYGKDTKEEIVQQMEAVTDNACIQSETCPERGEPYDESSCLSSEDCAAL